MSPAASLVVSSSLPCWSPLARFAVYQWGGRALVSRRCRRDISKPPRQEAARITRRRQLAGAAGRGQCRGLASGRAIESATAGKAAIFYIHPTTYLETDRWNAPLQPGGETEFRTQLFAQSQASAFNGAGKIWAPRYRQAAYGAFLLKSEDAEKALDFAYADVAAAFDRFREGSAGGQPDHPCRRTARVLFTSSICCARRSQTSRSRSGWSLPMSSAGRSARRATLRPLACPRARRRRRRAVYCLG